MIKKKLLLVLGILLILNLSLVSCVRSNVHVANETLTTNTSSFSNEDLDKKYVESIKPYLINISRDWSDFSKECSSGIEIFNNNTKIYFSDIKENWKELFNVHTEDTPNIIELKKILKNVNELQEKTINEFTNGLDNVNKEKFKQATKSLNKSDEIINNKLSSLIKKMNK